MKRFFSLFLFIALFVAGCSKNDPKPGPDEPKQPRVTTAVVDQYGNTTAVAGGSVADVRPEELTQVGVQYIAWNAEDGGEPAWGAAMTRRATEVAVTWSFTIDGLSPTTEYVVRAYVRTVAGEDFYGAVATFSTDPLDVTPPVVQTADAAEVDAVSALLGGGVSGTELSTLTEAGVQYVLWGNAATAEALDWSKAVDCKATSVAASWSVRAEGLEPSAPYGFRAYVSASGRRYYGPAKSFTTQPAAKKSLSVAELRMKHAASADVTAESVRGYVALSIPGDDTESSFAPGTVILYDNTGHAGSAIVLCGDAGTTGIAAAGLLAGDRVEVSLEGAVREVDDMLGPRYSKIAAAKVRVLDRGSRIDPVWVTPTQLQSNASGYFGSPVRLSRMYAETSGMLFSTDGNWFSDGEGHVAVWAKTGSAVGAMKSNGAMGTLSGICALNETVRIVPATAADVVDFTGAEDITTGAPAIGLEKEHYEFPPQGGTLVVDCAVTRPENMRLFADIRNIDPARYSVDIAGERVTVTARANVKKEMDADYINFYLYLAETREGARKSPVTVRLLQLGNVYESIPSLIQANGGELSSVHAAVVNGTTAQGMKLGSGSYTGHYTSDPLGAVGAKKLVFYAVGWQEGKHDPGTLYLRVENGGEASVKSFPLKINPGATGQAPFIMTVGAESRYEVVLTGLKPGSAVSFSTSPSFDKRADDKAGRALLFGVQLAD